MNRCDLNGAVRDPRHFSDGLPAGEGGKILRPSSRAILSTRQAAGRAGSTLSRRPIAIVIVLGFGLASGLAADPLWSSPQILDPRPPLEIAKLDLDPAGNTIYVPVL